ncbi:hypothetical protein [Paenibacillus catalpae]|uniref:hypothetical protein n=1 Tax=Paenibacillus catalpae TaxID=1045775 RepID=UPI001113A419|nr:hypothetical protein [Paenibacillus catalpae]
MKFIRGEQLIPVISKAFASVQGMVAEPADIKYLIIWIPLWYEDIYAFFSCDHPLAKVGKITLNNIADEPFIAMKKGSYRRLHSKATKLRLQQGLSQQV